MKLRSITLTPIIEEAIKIRKYLYGFTIFTYMSVDNSENIPLSEPLAIIEHEEKIEDPTVTGVMSVAFVALWSSLAWLL